MFNRLFRVFVCLLLNCTRFCKYILDISLLSGTRFENTLFPTCRCLFTTRWFLSLCRSFLVWRSPTYFFADFIACSLGVIAKKIIKAHIWQWMYWEHEICQKVTVEIWLGKEFCINQKGIRVQIAETCWMVLLGLPFLGNKNIGLDKFGFQTNKK